jgi:hypothetical protein
MDFLLLVAGGVEQALKLGAGATAVLGIFFLGFMASNGLL